MAKFTNSNSRMSLSDLYGCWIVAHWKFCLVPATWCVPLAPFKVVTHFYPMASIRQKFLAPLVLFTAFILSLPPHATSDILWIIPGCLSCWSIALPLAHSFSDFPGILWLRFSSQLSAFDLLLIYSPDMFFTPSVFSHARGLFLAQPRLYSSIAPGGWLFC